MGSGIKYVGMDVHAATTVVSVRTGNGRVMARAVLATQEEALVDFLGGMRGPIHVAFEEGTQAQWLCEVLRARVAHLVVCDRRGESRRGNKGDFGDADDLSARLRQGSLRAVYHGSAERTALKELARAYTNLVQDSSRVMLRLKALYRARAIATRGQAIYQPSQRSEWLQRLNDRGAVYRAQLLFRELDVLRDLRPEAKQALVAEARRDPGYRVLQTIPQLGPVRVALLLAVLQTPWRFRTKRNLWSYAGLAVVTRTSSEYEMANGRPIRRRRAPLTRGLNRNHNRLVKHVFKGAATGALRRPGALRDFYEQMLERGMRPELARVTLARKLAALTLRLWKTGERYDPTKLSALAH